MQHYQTVKKLEKKRVLILLKNGKEHFGKICNVATTEFHMEIPTEMSDKTMITISLEDVQKVLNKEYVSFLHPKIVLCKETDAAVTRHIETIKTEKEFKLQTRKYELQVNGSRKRSKWSAHEFEKVVAKWLDPKKLIEICPFALIKTNKEEFLLGVDRGKKLQKISKKGTTVLVQ